MPLYRQSASLTYLGLEPLEGHRPSTTVRQRPRSWAIRSNSLQVQPVCLASASRSLLQVLPCASHPIRAFRAVLESMIATPSVCAAFSSSCPEYNKSSPLASLFCPACSHLVSLSPSRAMLYRRISADTCAAFPASYMVLTFHVAMVVVFLVDRRVVGTEASFRLWPPHVILPAGAGPSSPRTGVCWAVVNASVAKSFFPG